MMFRRYGLLHHIFSAPHRGDFPSVSHHASGREGVDEVRQNTPEEIFDSRENSAQAENTAGRMSRQKVSPRRKAPRTRGRKSPLKKYGRRKERSHEWPVHSPFTFAAGTFQVERNVRNRCLPEKGSPRKKACCGACHAAAQEAPEKKISTAHTFCRKREEDEGAQERTAEYRWRKPFFDRRAEKLPEARTRLREKTGYGKGS